MTDAQPGLTVDGATVRFGGLVAVNDVTLRAEPGTITGLIGPNGAGKTTTFNSCAGVVPLSAGDIYLGDVALNPYSTARRAREGLGRTFQRMELFNSMTVAENVALGPEGLCASRHIWSQLLGSSRERRETRDRAMLAMERCDIVDLADQNVNDLSTGQRRLVELARAIASPFRFLLLDEPSSGLDVSETERFGQVLTDFVKETGVGVLLVEHDMALVSVICSYIFVLDFGLMIFSGPTETVLSSEIVRAAYLGSEMVPDGDTPRGRAQRLRPQVTGVTGA